MNTCETLTNLIEKGIGPITIGKPPTNAAPPGSVPKFFATADQNIPTGNFGNALQSHHQTVGESVQDCIKKLVDQCDEVEKLEVKPSTMIAGKNGGKVIVLPKGRIAQ
jgi:hypothetical protein